MILESVAGFIFYIGIVFSFYLKDKWFIFYIGIVFSSYLKDKWFIFYIGIVFSSYLKDKWFIFYIGIVFSSHLKDKWFIFYIGQFFSSYLKDKMKIINGLTKTHDFVFLSDILMQFSWHTGPHAFLIRRSSHEHDATFPDRPLGSCWCTLQSVI
ncbi:hypothetical protein JEOSCH030_00288 [Phocicoccus schoeneichii]|uniref:Uncharacterized protein n=1 Tax=Phocicoccus schoeneichii TaxID=1812261 RepID=A0A6V7R627_9BACL|nr:hypothetical protein JEOSCH030_00288 [Jeotgalicoccus schoeneichii]